MMFVDLRNSQDFIASKIKDTTDNKIESFVHALNKNGKLALRVFVGSFLDKNNVSENYKSDIIESIFELIYNALKANYLHVYSLSLLEKKYPNMDSKTSYGHYFLYEEDYRTDYLGFRKSQFVKDKVKMLMRLEANLIKEYDSGSLNDISKYKELHSFKQITGKPVRIKIVLSKFDDLLKCSIINESPVTLLDFGRIHQKRAIFREYYDKGMLNKFYDDNLDESESAGFGATLIDLRLLHMGLEPYNYFTITTDGIHTKSSVSLPTPK